MESQPEAREEEAEMKTTLRTRRILLDEKATEQLKEMMVTLAGEGDHLSLVPSKAVSWIVSEFATRYFAKDKTKMAEVLFNRKSFLRSVLKGITDGSNDEIQALESTLRGLRRGRSVPPPSIAAESKTAAKSDDL